MVSPCTQVKDALNCSKLGITDVKNWLDFLLISHPAACSDKVITNSVPPKAQTLFCVIFFLLVCFPNLCQRQTNMTRETLTAGLISMLLLARDDNSVVINLASFSSCSLHNLEYMMLYILPQRKKLFYIQLSQELYTFNSYFLDLWISFVIVLPIPLDISTTKIK